MTDSTDPTWRDAGARAPVERAARTFPCANCGAALAFAPGVGRLVCASCGTVNDAPHVADSARAAALEELDYAAQLARRAGDEPEIAPLLVTCPQCGAQTSLGAHVVADRCAFCATPLVSVAAHEGRLIQPRGLVPFAMEQAAAQDTFRQWIAGRWFAPNALKRTVRNLDRVRGVYLPCWTFDAHTTSDYVGQRGIDRQETYTTRDAQGNERVMTRTVTDWYPASGTVVVDFNDTLVPASHSLPANLATVLQDWDIRALVPCADDYMAGFTVEAYQLALAPAFEEAKSAFGAGILTAAQADIGGSQQRVHDIRTRYEDITFKHILLPAWICSYRFGDKSWRVVVNGQTGAVKGDRPWSPWKIGFAVLCAMILIAVLAFLQDR